MVAMKVISFTIPKSEMEHARQALAAEQEVIGFDHINVTDKIYVLRNGTITGSLMREEATEEKVLALAMKED